MPLADFLESTLAKLEVHYHQMGRAIESPIRAKNGNQMFFRHPQYSDVLLCYTPRGADRHVFSMRKANEREQARIAPLLEI